MYNLDTRDMPKNKHITSLMLEQRRAQQKGYITLKEAAEISNYSPDYVGQLIRAGKIKGEQVYSNVAWVTTADEIEAYLQNKNRSVQTTASDVTSSQPYFLYGLYGVIGVLAVVLLFLQYILYISFDRKVSSDMLERSAEVEIVANPALVYE